MDELLTEHEVELRKKHFNMTDAQARREPGWNIANHRREDGKYHQIWEKRDETGQLIKWGKWIS